MGRILAGRYNLDELVGTGGMAAVWRATDETLHRIVAVKLVELDQTAIPDAAERFRREAQIAASLIHPNIVTIYDFGVDDSTAFIVMELLEGPTLAQLLTRSGPMAVDEAIAIADQVAAALETAHAGGIVHRDIKPGNIAFASPGEVKVLDFGVARLVEATTGVGISATVGIIGTASYLAPEQVRGRTADARSDLYAFGCLLMAMLAGRPPFIGDDPIQVSARQVDTPPPHLRDLRPEVPLGLDTLISELIAKNPEGRPASATDVRRKLAGISDSLAGNEPTVAMAAGEATMPIPLDPAPGAGIDDPTVLAPPGNRLTGQIGSGSSRHRTRAILVGSLLGLALLGVALGLLLAGSPGHPRSPVKLTTPRHSRTAPTTSTTILQPTSSTSTPRTTAVSSSSTTSLPTRKTTTTTATTTTIPTTTTVTTTLAPTTSTTTVSTTTLAPTTTTVPATTTAPTSTTTTSTTTTTTATTTT